MTTKRSASSAVSEQTPAKSSPSPTSAAPTVRRFAPTKAPRPQIAREILRTVSAAEHARDVLAPHCDLQLRDALAVVSDALNSVTVGAHRDVVADTLSTAAYRVVSGAVAVAEQQLAELSGVDSATFREPASQQAALAHTGVLVADVAPTTLRAYASHPAVNVVMWLQQLYALERSISSGELRNQLQRCYAAGEPHGTLNDVIADLTARGIDGERLAWAVITFETHKHIPLVWHQCNKLTRRFPDRRASDLFGWGWQGLRVALRAYDPEHGAAFSTYACTRIRGQIQDGVRSEEPIPKRLTTFVRKVARAEDALAQSLGRAPDLAELAEELGSTIDQLRILPRLAPAASIEELTTDSDDRPITATWLVDDGDPADQALATARSEAIQQALARLPEDEATAVRLLVLEERTVAEAREATGANARQLRQRKERGLAQLAGHLAAWRDEAVAV